MALEYPRALFRFGSEPVDLDRLCLSLARSLAPFLAVLLALLFVLFSAARCVAMEPANEITQYVQTAVSDKNGLPQNSVSSVTQTRDGYMWFGTQEGLGRYDGMHVTVFDITNHRALKDNFIEAMAPGRDGSLWVGTRSSLSQLKDGEFHNLFTPQSPIDTIYEASDGKVWVGSQEGLYAVDGGNVRLYTTKDGLPNNAIAKIVQTDDGTLWFATHEGLASLRDGKFKSYDAKDGLTPDQVLALTAGQDGSLWIATSNALVRWKGHVLETAPMEALSLHDQITSLIEDRKGALWVGFDHSGIALLREGKFSRYTAKQGLPNEDVSALFEDRDGHVWAALSEGGVVELRDGIFSNFGMLEGLSEDMVWSVLEARDHSMWVGTNSKGLDHIDKDGKVRVYTAHDGLPGGSIFALREDADGSIWVGAEDGALSRIKNDHVTVYDDPMSKGKRIVSILTNVPVGTGGKADAAGDLWLAFHENNGLTRFHLDASGQGHFQHFAVPGLLNAAAVAPDGSIWVGGDHAGVSQFKNGAVVRYTTVNGLLANFAQAVYVDRDGVVWAGTSPGGLNRIKNGHVTTYSIEQGLFDQTVGAIIEDDEGNLWMTCNKGIYKVSKKELNDYADGRISTIHSTVYGTGDGLRSSECNFGDDPSVWKAIDGRLWFATTGGIASVDPKHSQTISAQPTPLIESVHFNEHAVGFSNGVKAGPGGGDFEIQFTTPDFVAPERIRFRYRLQNSDTDWVDAGDRREAVYTKLPPGDYVFEVQAADQAHGWSTNGARLTIALKPHFWQTNWFRALAAVVLLFICGGAYGLRVHYLVSRNRVLEERVERRTDELKKALKAAEDAGLALHEQATKDGLTLLWNRRSIFEMLSKELPRAHRGKSSTSVLMADLDHFKQINDTYGHQIGDRVLQVVAERVMSLTRSYDFVGRYGGEEFVIVLPGCSLDDGLRRAEEFRRAIAESAVQTSAGPIYVTCSFGIAENFSEESTAEELINKADEALYCAKKAGRNCVYRPGNVNAAAEEVPVRI